MFPGNSRDMTSRAHGSAPKTARPRPPQLTAAYVVSSEERESPWRADPRVTRATARLSTADGACAKRAAAQRAARKCHRAVTDTAQQPNCRAAQEQEAMRSPKSHQPDTQTSTGHSNKQGGTKYHPPSFRHPPPPLRQPPPSFPHHPRHSRERGNLEPIAPIALGAV